MNKSRSDEFLKDKEGLSQSQEQVKELHRDFHEVSDPSSSNEEALASSLQKVYSKDLLDSLTLAQNQLGLCLQNQRKVGFILKEIKHILKR